MRDSAMAARQNAQWKPRKHNNSRRKGDCFKTTRPGSAVATNLQPYKK